MTKEKDIDFYKKFYEENRIRLIQYENLRAHFTILVDKVLGEDYYNMGMDVYKSDQICCEGIERKARGFWSKFFRSR